MEQYREPTTRDERQHVLQLATELIAAVERLTGAPAVTADKVPLPPEPPIKLPKRWREFLRLLCDSKGHTYKEIAHIMHCHTSTLRTYRERIFERYGIKGKGNLIRWAVGKGLVRVRRGLEDLRQRGILSLGQAPSHEAQRTEGHTRQADP